ncbi:MAG TPA: aminotransferase class V-fold PLP-dependent enzyme [Acidobacteriaceae bacterium]|jgi:aspartate aminotransferase-like enzyme|nr:aminotransferase class V-fold PLP-dependent enzyme [Acidobacteriaceae bacterium]
MTKLLFRQAVSAADLEQIHALNHRVFAEEIAQHGRHPSGLLVDRFHEQNRYFVALREDVVIGMISAHPGPEFSVRRRLPDASLLESLPCPIEVRLLAIEPKERNRTVLAGLLWQAYDYALSGGYSHLLISAISTRQAMYQKMGFHALGPAVPEGEASFVPMLMTLDEHRRVEGDRVGLHERHWHRAAPPREAVSLLPGPVAIHPRVAAAFASAPVSHRSPAFVETYERVREQLRAFAAGMDVVLFPGAGTLANDAVAANLKAIFGDAEGVVLANGEFGERLVKQARAAGLRCKRLGFPYGRPWEFGCVEAALDGGAKWVWGVHLETSTGVLNDAASLQRVAGRPGCAVALDCVSSIGATPIPADGDHLLLASGVSGKSFGAYAGLAMVYMSDACRGLLKDKVLCPSFDLLRMRETRGPVSTISSPSLFALSYALDDSYGSATAMTRRFAEYRRLGERVRAELRAAGLQLLAAEAVAAPNITTFDLPYASFPEECARAGYLIAHESPYLQTRGWGQIATMGDIRQETLTRFFAAIRARASQQQTPGVAAAVHVH